MLRRRYLAAFVAAVLAAVKFAACGEPVSTPKGNAQDLEVTALMDPTGDQATQTAPDEFKVRFETSAGTFIIDVTRDWSPRGADRFYSLIRIGFYDDQRFFRVIPNFVVQWGMSGNRGICRLADGEDKGRSGKGKQRTRDDNFRKTRRSQLAYDPVVHQSWRQFRQPRRAGLRPLRSRG